MHRLGNELSLLWLISEAFKASSASVIAPAESVSFGGENKAKPVDVCVLVLWTWVRLPPAPPFLMRRDRVVATQKFHMLLNAGSTPAPAPIFLFCRCSSAGRATGF